MNAFPDTSADIKSALRHELLRLARFEENRASAEAATVPYWSPCPPSVEAHRKAAAVLRADADTFLGVA